MDVENDDYSANMCLSPKLVSKIENIQSTDEFCFDNEGSRSCDKNVDNQNTSDDTFYTCLECSITPPKNKNKSSALELEECFRYVLFYFNFIVLIH